MNIRMTAQQSSVRGAALPATTIETREGRFMWAFFALLICMLFSGASYAAEPYPSRAIRILVAYRLPASPTSLHVLLQKACA
jgi:hypothetical protein